MNGLDADAIALRLFARGAARAWVYELGDAHGWSGRLMYVRHAGVVVRERTASEPAGLVVLEPSAETVDAEAACEALFRMRIEPATALRVAWESRAVPRCAAGLVPQAGRVGLDEGVHDGWLYARCPRTHEAFAVRIGIPAAATRGEA